TISLVLSGATSTILTGDNNYVLQYAILSANDCSLQATGFSVVTDSTPISFYTNSGVDNGSAIAVGATDPVDAGTTVAQTYRSGAGVFTNSKDIPPGYTGLFDFSLRDNEAAANTTYCL